MGVMKDLNQYIIQRGNRWHYVRRVPNEYADIDPRGIVRRSLKTESLEVARARRDALAQADDHYWASCSIAPSSGSGRTGVAGISKHAERRYQSARKRAMARGFVYTPMDELAEVGDIAELLDRLKSLSETREPVRQDVEAVLGAVEPPVYKVSEALDVYCREIAVKDLLGKSDPQKKSWQKVKRRAVNNFIRVVGDLPMNEITRDHGRKFYNWWAKRLQPNGKQRALTSNSANRDLGNLRKLYREFWEYQGDETRENPFRKLNFGNHGLRDIPHFEDEWVRSKFLKPSIFEGLNSEATLLVYAMIETGCRPSELANLTRDQIHLNHEIPFVSIKPTSNRQLKSEASARDIPLVGVSLEAFKNAPDGFPHYRDRGTLLSASLMKAFRTRGLFPSKDHRIYSFRHSFEKRMLESGLDFGLRCLLMGHKNARPAYGDGGSLEYRRDQLLKIAHPIPQDFSSDLANILEV